MLQRIFIFILPLIILSTESANAEITLRDAIYLYNQDYYANGSTSIGSYNCDVFQLVLDVEDGYADLNMYRGDTSLSSSKYPDRIYSSASMFSYMLYGADKYKLFSFEDNNGAATSISKIGKGTVFGYCLSSNSDAFVFLEDRAQCIFKFSDGSTGSISNCTPTSGSSNTSPTGELSDLYGLVTFNYKFNGGTTTYSDSVQFSRSSVQQNGTLAAARIGSTTKAVGCTLLTSGSYRFLCAVAWNTGPADVFAFNLNNSYQISGIYEFCSSGLTSTCASNLASSPDGTVWGSINRSGVTLAAKISGNDEAAMVSEKEQEKFNAAKREIEETSMPSAAPDKAANINDLAEAINAIKALIQTDH